MKSYFHLPILPMAVVTAAIDRRAAFGDNLAELTTVFTPPCLVSWLLTTTKVPSQYPQFPTTGPSSCDPPSWTDNIAQRGFGYYSPAICPGGFFAACTVNDERTSEGFPALTAGETAMYCVPSGFTCTSDTTDFRGGVWGFTRTASASGASVTVGPALQIRWREEDLSNLATDPLTPGASVARGVPGQPDQPDVALSTTKANINSIPTLLPINTPTRAEATGSHTEISFTPTQAFVTTRPSLPPSSGPLFTTTSLQPKSTPPTASEGTSSHTEPVPNTPGVGSSTSVAAMALSGTLIAILLGFLAVTIFRRYRRYRAGKIKSFLPLHIREWLSRFADKRNAWFPSYRNATTHPPRSPDAELGADGPISELGPGNPLGTKENPAELAGSGVRNSWMSHVSRIFTVRVRKEGWSI